MPLTLRQADCAAGRSSLNGFDPSRQSQSMPEGAVSHLKCIAVFHSPAERVSRTSSAPHCRCLCQAAFAWWRTSLMLGCRHSHPCNAVPSLGFPKRCSGSSPFSTSALSPPPSSFAYSGVFQAGTERLTSAHFADHLHLSFGFSASFTAAAPFAARQPHNCECRQNVKLKVTNEPKRFIRVRS